MFRVRVIRGVVLAAVLVGVCAYHPQWAIAQVAPTNSASITGSVLTSSGAPVAGAKVSISGPKNATTQTDAHGLFVFIGAPFGTYQISATAASLGTASEQVVVQEDINVAIQFSGLKTIANVATNAQFNVTPASITHVDPLQDALNGETDWRHILEEIPGVSITAANGNYVYGMVPDNPLLDLQISIDGALPYETAELFDDMPFIGNSLTTAAGAGTNLGVYPLNGFGAADVVRGPGANAPSIVDSVGGSFVLHPPGLVTRDHEAFSFTRDAYGGIDFTGLLAEHFGKLSVTATYGFLTSPGPSGPPTLNANWEPYLVDGKSFHAPGVGYLYRSGYQRYGREGYSTGLLTCCYSQYYGWSQHSGSLALSYAITPRVTAAVYYSGQSEGIPYYQAINATDFIPPAGYTGSVPAGEMNLSPGNYGFENGNTNAFYQRSALFEEKVTAQIGAGVLRVAFLQNTTTNGVNAPGYAGPPVGQLYGGGSICSNTSPGCSTGTYSPVVFNGGTYNLVSESESLVCVALTKNHDYLLGYTTPLSNNMQAGISFVQSSYNEPYGGSLSETAGFGSSGYSFTAFVGDTEETQEMRIFFGTEPTPKTTVNLSWYFVGADYHVPSLSNANLHTDSKYPYSAPRLGFVWEPSANVSVRAAIGGGFAEAPMEDLAGYNSGIPNCSGGITCTLDQPNLNLQPEKSFAFDLGTDVRLSHHTLASFDLYQANLFGQIQNVTIPDGTYTGLPLYLTSYENLAHTRYEGVLIDLRNTVSHGLTWSASAGLTRGYLVSVPAGFYNTATCTNCTNTGLLTNINFDAAFSGVVPYAQGHATIGYQWEPSKFVTLMGTYYGNNNSYLRPAFTEWDADVSYPITKYGSLLLSFTNITGVYDQAVGIIDPGAISIVPAIPGAEPFAYNNGVYGPRSILVTLQFSHLGAR